MHKIISKIQHGATLLEYAILVALIALVAMSAVSYLGVQVACKFESIEAQHLRRNGNYWSGMVDISPTDYRSCS
jgi:Flp pilus assembly pilin Flp